MTTRKPDPQLGPTQTVPPLKTPCTLQQLQQWLKDLHAVAPGTSATATIDADRNEISAVIEGGRSG
jgi:hypothetical protein